MLGVLVGFFVTMQLPWGTDCGSSWWWKEGEGGRWVHCQPWTPNCNLRQMLLKTTNTCWKPMLFPDGISSGAAWKEEEAVGAYATTVHVWLLFTPSGSLWVPLEASFLCSVPATPWRLPWAAALSTCFVCYPLPLALYALKNQGNFPSVRDSAVFFAVLIEAGGVLMCVCVCISVCKSVHVKPALSSQCHPTSHCLTRSLSLMGPENLILFPWPLWNQHWHACQTSCHGMSSGP